MILGHKPCTVSESVVVSLVLTRSKENTSESSEVPEVNEVNETLFGEHNNGDETVAPESAKKSPDDTMKKGNTVWCKCLTGDNFDEFDKSKLHHQNFPYQYFTFQ